MKKLTTSTKGEDLGTPRGRDNGEGQAGMTSEFSKKMPLPAIEPDPDFPATVLNAATMHIRPKPALQSVLQLSAQRKADLPRLIPGRSSPPNLPGRPQGPCGDLPHRTVEGSTKRDRSSGSQKHLINPPWAPCKVVDPNYIGNICFDRLPKGLKHLEPVDLCYRHGHHRRLNPLGKAQNDGPNRRSCTNLRAHVHKQKVQEKKTIPAAFVKTETTNKPEDTNVRVIENMKRLGTVADSGSKPDPCDLLKPEDSFVSSIGFLTDSISCRSSCTVSKEQSENFSRETSQASEQSGQMPSAANGDCQPRSTFRQTIPTCTSAEDLHQTTRGVTSLECVQKETLVFSEPSEKVLSDDGLKVPDENPRDENSSQPHKERRGSLSSCLPKSKLRTDDVSKSFSALSSKEKELVDVGKTNLKYTMPHEHREKVVEIHANTDIDIPEGTVSVDLEKRLRDDARTEVKQADQQQQDETSRATSALVCEATETLVTQPRRPLTQVVSCPDSESKMGVPDELKPPVLTESFGSPAKTQLEDSENPQSLDTKVPSHNLLSLPEEVSKGTPGHRPKAGMRSKIPVRVSVNKGNAPASTKHFHRGVRMILRKNDQDDPSEESSGSVQRSEPCHPEEEDLQYSKVYQDMPNDPTSTCKVDRACTNKTGSKLKANTKHETKSATASLKEASSNRDPENKSKLIVEKNTLCLDDDGEGKSETVLLVPDSQPETADQNTDQESFDDYPDLAIGVRLFRTPVEEIKLKVSNPEIQTPEKENVASSETQNLAPPENERKHKTPDVREIVDSVINNVLLSAPEKSKDGTVTQEKASPAVVKAVPKSKPLASNSKDSKSAMHEETCRRDRDQEKVILKNLEENKMQIQKRNRVKLTTTDKDITPQPDVKSRMDNVKNVQGMQENSETPSLQKVDEKENPGEGESLTMYVPPLPRSTATQTPTTEGPSKERLPCTWRINLDANRLDHLLRVQDNSGGSRGRGDWKERPVNYVDPNISLEDMLTKYFTDHTPLDSAFRAINIVNSYSSSISYDSHQTQERVVAALQKIKQEEVYKHAVICPLASQCADATREFGESLYKAFRRFSNRSRAAQEAMIEYYRALADDEIMSPEVVKQIRRDGRKLFMVWEGGRYVTRYAEEDEGSSGETTTDDSTGQSLTNNHNPSSGRKEQ